MDNQLTILSDVSQNRSLRDALQTTEEYLRETRGILDSYQTKMKTILELSKRGIWDWNILNDEVFYDPLWAEIMGYCPSEIKNGLNTWSKTVHPDDLPMAARKMKDHLEGALPLYEMEYRAFKKNGEMIWVLMKGKLCLRGDNGEPLRMIGTIQDITDRKSVV